MSGSGNMPMTPSGLRKLKDELKQLQTVERVKISHEIEVARRNAGPVKSLSKRWTFGNWW